MRNPRLCAHAWIFLSPSSARFSPPSPPSSLSAHTAPCSWPLVQNVFTQEGCKQLVSAWFKYCCNILVYYFVCMIYIRTSHEHSSSSHTRARFRHLADAENKLNSNLVSPKLTAPTGFLHAGVCCRVSVCENVGTKRTDWR